jgi:hypothetical protein
MLITILDHPEEDPFACGCDMDVFLELYQLKGSQEEKQAIHTDMYHLNPDNSAR